MTHFLTSNLHKKYDKNRQTEKNKILNFGLDL